MKIIVINGVGGVGKDEFVRQAKSELEHIYNFSMVDEVKRLARRIGWEGNKTEKDRKFLSDLKDALEDYNNLPFNSVLDSIRITLDGYAQMGMPTTDLIFFIHCREPKDIDKWVKDYGAQTLLIRREDEKIDWGNHADASVYDYDYHYVYVNDGDLGRLKKDAVRFIEFIRRLKWISGNEELKSWDEEILKGVK